MQCGAITERNVRTLCKQSLKKVEECSYELRMKATPGKLGMENCKCEFLTLFLFKTGRDTLWFSIKTKFRFITQFLTKLLSFPHSSSKTRNGIFAPGGLSLRPGKCRKVTPKKSVKESKNRHSCFGGNDPRHFLSRFRQ